jgi:hypothetical protein
MAMGDAKPSVLIPMPSRDRDRDLLVPPAAAAAHASPSTRAGAESDDDESKPSSASAASAAAQTGREVAAFVPLPPLPLSAPLDLHRWRLFGSDLICPRSGNA